MRQKLLWFVCGALVCGALLGVLRFIVHARAINPQTALAAREYRHAEFMARIREGRTPIVLLGDSITDFWRTRPEEFSATFGDKAANFGVGGDLIQNVLWRIENGELQGDPQMVVLLIGTNNIGVNSPSAIADGIANLVARIKARAPNAQIILMALLPRFDSAASAEAVRQVNAGIAKIGGVTVLDIGNQLPPDFLFDGIHLTPDGYRVWGAAMKPFVTSPTPLHPQTDAHSPHSPR